MLNMQCPKCNNKKGNTKKYCGKLREPKPSWYEDKKYKLELPNETFGYKRNECLSNCPTEEHFHVHCVECDFNWSSYVNGPAGLCPFV